MDGEASEDPPRRTMLFICDARASSRRRSTPQDSGGVGREGREGTNRPRRRRLGGARADAHVARAERSRARLGRRATGDCAEDRTVESAFCLSDRAANRRESRARQLWRLAVRRHTRVFFSRHHTPACSPRPWGSSGSSSSSSSFPARGAQRACPDRSALGIGADSIARCRPLSPARTWTR